MLERTADDIDAAGLHEARTTENSVKFVQSLLAPQTHPDFNGSDCLDCGEVVHEKRLEAGRIRCTDCETRREAKSKYFS